VSNQPSGYGDKFWNRIDLWDSLGFIISTAGFGNFQPGEVLLDPGKNPRQILLITRGIVQVTRHLESGQDAFLRLSYPGEVLGEESLLDLRRPRPMRSFTASALTTVTTRVISTDDMRSFLETHPQAWTVLAEDLWARLDEADTRITELSCERADRRLARLLWDLNRHGGVIQADGGKRLPLEVSQATLALWIGASRETVERALARWRKRHIISTAQRVIVVHDAAALASIAGIHQPGVTATQ
jgi:CRP-like cAMP-binding protein